MLRITINESEGGAAKRLILEGRIAGPWAEELDRVWVEAAPRLGSSKLTIDVRDVTYADAAGKNVLVKIFSQVDAEFVAGPLQAHDLATEIIKKSQQA
jgi:hypothetical protein